MLKIAIAGKMRAGKDSCFDYIKLKYFPNALRFSFAFPLYKLLNICQSFCGFEQKKERDFLQFVGDWGRQHDKSIWITLLLNEVSKIPENIPVVVTDARYLNELKELEKNNYIIIKVEANENIRVIRGATNTDHSSENEVDLFHNYDYIISNNGSFDDLYKQLDTIICDMYTFN